jgi:hypothetical protein
MFKSVYLGNFKAFGPTQRIPIRPLTLIFGPNSAGKSSFLHGLLYAHEALTSDEPNNLDVKRPRLGGDSVDLGGFRQLIHKKNIAHRVEWGVELDTAELQGRLAELLAPVKTVSVIVTIGLEELEVADPHQLPLEGPDVGKQVVVTIPSYEPGNRNQKITVTLGPRVETYRIEVDSTVLLRASVKRRGEEWRMGVDELDTEHPVIHNVVRAIVEATTTAASFNPEDTQAVQDAIDQLVTDLSLAPGPLLPTGVQRSGGPQAEGGQPALFPISRGNRREDLRQAVLFFLPRSLNELVRELADVIGRRLRSLRYLGPLRSYPPRHLAFAQYHDPNWHAGGGFAWDRVRTSPEIREATNKWLGSAFMKTPYQLLVRNLYADDDLYDPLWSTLENVELDTEVDYDRDGPQGSYQHTDFEPRRSKLASVGSRTEPGAQSQTDFLDSHFRKALRHASRIVLCDRLFGRKYGDNYEYTITKVLRWLEAVLDSPATCTLEVHCERPPGLGHRALEGDLKAGRTGRLGSLRMTVYYYNNPGIEDVLPHERFVLTDQFAFSIDRGLDFLDKSTKRNRDVSVRYADADSCQTTLRFFARKSPPTLAQIV